jgi:hypothetical protein
VRFAATASGLLFLMVATGVAKAAVPRRAVAPPVSTTWKAQLSAEKSGAQILLGRQLASSSALLVRWTAPSVAVDHYALSANETAGGVPLSFSAAGSATSMTLTRLEAGTAYRVSIRACLDASCASSLTADAAATAATEDEYWQIRGTGGSYATADKLVSDGNTKPYALLWGPDAGAGLAGKAQLYYDPSVANEKGVKIATLPGAITSSPSSVASFQPLSGFGFLRGDSVGHNGTGPATMQPVALSSRLGGKVRLFWEATDANGRGRVYSADSADGWQGRDFHSGGATICQEADLAPGGGCPATLLIGGETEGNPKVREARQLKVGTATLDDWRWDGEAGTFMVVTLHLTDTVCSSTFFNMGQAVWDTTRWNLQYDAKGCPKLIPGVQAPMPVHIGGSRYKLYFSNNTSGTGGGATSLFKPLKMLYADGAASGSASLVDFEDWESITRARPVHVLWPNGVELTDAETSQFDDYQVWMPTRDPSLQVIYTNMACPANACGPPFCGMAVLANP